LLADARARLYIYKAFSDTCNLHTYTWRGFHHSRMTESAYGGAPVTTFAFNGRSCFEIDECERCLDVGACHCNVDAFGREIWSRRRPGIRLSLPRKIRVYVQQRVPQCSLDTSAYPYMHVNRFATSSTYMYMYIRTVLVGLGQRQGEVDEITCFPTSPSTSGWGHPSEGMPRHRRQTLDYKRGALRSKHPKL